LRVQSGRDARETGRVAWIVAHIFHPERAVGGQHQVEGIAVRLHVGFFVEDLGSGGELARGEKFGEAGTRKPAAGQVNAILLVGSQSFGNVRRRDVGFAPGEERKGDIFDIGRSEGRRGHEVKFRSE